MRESTGYLTTPHAAADIMTFGYRKLVRLSQTDVRRSREISDAIAKERFGEWRFWQGVLALAVFYKASLMARLEASDMLLWVECRYGSEAIAEYAIQNLGMRPAINSQFDARTKLNKSS